MKHKRIMYRIYSHKKKKKTIPVKPKILKQYYEPTRKATNLLNYLEKFKMIIKNKKYTSKC